MHAFDDGLVAALVVSGSAVPVERHGVDFAVQCLVEEMRRQEMHLRHEQERIAGLRAELAETEQSAWMTQNKIAACKAALGRVGSCRRMKPPPWPREDDNVAGVTIGLAIGGVAWAMRGDLAGMIVAIVCGGLMVALVSWRWWRNHGHAATD